MDFTLKIMLESDLCDDEYKSKFFDALFFIGYYIEDELWKLKFESKLNGLRIVVGKPDMPIGITRNFISVGIPFDKQRFEKANQERDFGYYCELYRQGINKLDGYTDVPKSLMLEFLDNFERNGYKCEWLLVNKLFRKYGLKAKFMCDLTTDAFYLKGYFYDQKSKRELCHGTIFRIIPYQEAFCRAWRKIREQDGYIVFDEYIYEFELVKIKISELLEGKFRLIFPEKDDLPELEEERLKRIIEDVQYKGKSTL